MLMTLHLLAGLLYALALVGLLPYGLNAYIMIALHWWTRRSPRAAPPPPGPAGGPLVPLQLPLFHKRHVAGRLLEGPDLPLAHRGPIARHRRPLRRRADGSVPRPSPAQLQWDRGCLAPGRHRGCRRLGP